MYEMKIALQRNRNQTYYFPSINFIFYFISSVMITRDIFFAFKKPESLFRVSK